VGLFGRSKPKESQIPFTCHKTGEGFTVFIKHNKSPAKHEIVGIKRVEETGRALRLFKPKPPKQTVHSAEVEWENFYCPWCGADKESKGTDWVRCGECTGMFCAHHVSKVDGKLFWGSHGTCQSSGLVELGNWGMGADKSGGMSSQIALSGGRHYKPLPAPDRRRITKK
jgi:hypothetical protein